MALWTVIVGNEEKALVMMTLLANSLWLGLDGIYGLDTNDATRNADSASLQVLSESLAAAEAN